MHNDLINSDNYCVFTFGTTSHALKAESVLKDLGAEFIIMPTLREITASCGLSLKIKPENVKSYFDLLAGNNVTVESVYRVQKIHRQNYLEKLC